MTNCISLSRAVATATAALAACVLACALPGMFASPAAAFSPPLKTGGENTALNLKAPSTGAAATSSGGASIVRTIVGLAIVIAVIWGLAWILRQVKAGREGGRDGHRPSGGLASVAALTLGTGRSVHLVRAGNDYVLLGSTEHGVAPIHRYTEEQAREAGLLPADGAELVEQPAPRSRLLSTASQIVAGTGRAAVHAGLVNRRELPAPGESSFSDGAYGPFDASAHSPVAGRRPDPMRMTSPSSGVIERLRELTVRR
jgi:flagellar protein FliO/FliZ